MFVDKITIKVKGGDGGDGCCSFRREAFIPKGGPDGGDGGRGGDVVIETASGEQSLSDLVYKTFVEAGRGGNGKGKDMFGGRGADAVIRVPPGTLVKDAATGDVIVDLDKPDMRFVIASGGKGGRGNNAFASSTNRAPRIREDGLPGEEEKVILELKVIADVGLVGYPNAGKSSLIKAVSNANPKVAAYPFTTLHPVVGVVPVSDYEKFTMADIPGLIDGAHQNIGLGHAFLKHIERTRILAYVLDAAGVDGRDPLDDFHSLQKELEFYQEGLSKRKAVIIANKSDLPESAVNIKKIKKQLGKKYSVFIMCARSDVDFSALVNHLAETLKELEKAENA
jgi:GTP-binding protein